MKKLFSLVSLALVLHSPATIFAQASSPAKNIVLVHGAFTDGSGWEAVYNILNDKGYHVTIVQNPLTSLEDDVVATERALDKQNGATVLVGHSWGGTVITQAGLHANVKSLVYVAAFAPDAGESTLDLVKTAPPAPENGILPPDKNGLIYYDSAKFHAGFAADVTKKKAAFMWASQSPIAAKAFITPVSAVAWKTKPSWAIVATEDKSINPIIERTMYKRANARVTELKGSHVLFMVNAAAVAAVIEAAAK